MSKRNISRIALSTTLLVALVITTIGIVPNTTSASTFGIGDTVEVYNTGGSGLLVLNAPCGSTIGGKFDGASGVVLDGPVYCYNYNRWLIRWSDGLQGWSAENWLKKVSSTPDSTPAADTTKPTVNSFSVTPSSVNVGGSFNISYSVSDTGGSGLNRVELWRANDSGGSPVNWGEVRRTSASGNSYSSSFSDTPSAGTYWYGIHVVDNAGNWAAESSPVRVTVIAALPTELTVTEPTILRAPLDTPQVQGELRSAKMTETEVVGGFLGLGLGKSVATYSFEIMNTGQVDWRDIKLAPLPDIEILKAWYEQGFIRYVDSASVLFPTAYLSDSAQMRVGRIVEVPWIKLFNIAIGKRQKIEWVSDWTSCEAVIENNVVKAIKLPQPVPAGLIMALIVKFEAPAAGTSHSACFALQTEENAFFPPPLDVSFRLTHIGK